MPGSWQFWAALSALFSALVALWGKLGVEGMDTRLVMAIRTSVVLVLAWGLWGLTGAQGLGEVSAKSWRYLTLSGVATGLAWLCYYHALKLGDAALVAPVDKLSVVLVIALAMIFLGERPTAWQLAGGGLIFAGVLLMAWPRPG